MNVNIEKDSLNLSEDEFAVDFETERTPVRLGKSDKYFYMDFNDTNFPTRLMQSREDIAKFFEEKRNELKQNESTEDMNIEEIDRLIALTNELDEFIKSKVNFTFGYDVSKDVFGQASSLSVTRKGEYYFDNFLNAVLPLVEREFNIRMQATNERIKKYTDRKGMHPHLALKK